MKQRFTLGKQERLKSRKVIEQLFKEGRSFSVFPYRVQYTLSPADTGAQTFALQAGVAVSSKYFKKAVHRNKIKRLTREAYRLQKNRLQQKLSATDGQLSLFIIFTGKEIPDYLLIKEKLQLILDKLSRVIDENPPPHT